MDEKHVGLSGLGLLGYVLENNGFVRFQVNVIHPFEVIYRNIWERVGGTIRDVFMAIGSHRYRNTSLLTPEEIMRLCEDIGIVLNTDEKHAIYNDIAWDSSSIKVNELCKKCLMTQDFRPNFMSELVHYRLAIDEQCLKKMQSSGSNGNRAPVFAEYSNRCVTNPTSKDGLQFAKRTILKLYNLKRETELDTMNAFTPSTLRVLKSIMKNENMSSIIHHSHKSKSKNDIKHTQRRQSASKRNIYLKQRGNAYASLIQTLFVSTSVTEGVEFKDVRTMHILEPPKDYRQLEQMFGRVIRRGSHAGLRAPDRSVEILLYVLSTSPTLRTVKQHSNGQMTKPVTTADEMYWNKVIKCKYEISQEFYQLLKHVAMDCRHNLVLNSESFQDKHLTCFEYPYQRNLQDWNDGEVPLFTPMDNELLFKTKSSNSNAINIQQIMDMIQFNN